MAAVTLLGSSVAGSSGSRIGHIDLDKQVMAAMKHASKAHSEWDRAKRQWRGTLAQSALNSRTKDTEMHQELE